MKTTPKEVFDILCHLKKGKAAGIDEITPDLLRLCASGIAESLSALFNKSFNSSKFPSHPVEKGISCTNLQERRQMLPRELPTYFVIASNQ